MVVDVQGAEYESHCGEAYKLLVVPEVTQEHQTVSLGLLSRSHTLSLLHQVNCLWGVGKLAEQSMWGFQDHLELGYVVFVKQPAGFIKRLGRVRKRKGRALQGQIGVRRKLRVHGF